MAHHKKYDNPFLKIKRWLPMVLVFVFAWPYLFKTVVIVNFYLNRDKIAKEICIQKDIPNNCCKGSCKLNEDLAKVNQPDSPNEKPLQLLYESHLVDSLLFQRIIIPCFKGENHGIYYQMAQLYRWQNPIEHPPQGC